MRTRHFAASALLSGLLIASCGNDSPGEAGMISLEVVPPSITLHEPVFLRFEAVNNTFDESSIRLDLGAERLEMFEVELWPDGETWSRVIRPPSVLHTGAEVVLEPGEVHAETMLLNRLGQIEEPGDYTLKVRFLGSVERLDGSAVEIERTFRLPLEVEPRSEEVLRRIGERLADEACGGNLGAALDAAQALGYIEDVAVIPALEKVLKCTFVVQVAAVQGLGRLGTPQAIGALLDAAGSPNDELRELARSELEAILRRSGDQLDVPLRRRIEHVLTPAEH